MLRALGISNFVNIVDIARNIKHVNINIIIITVISRHALLWVPLIDIWKFKRYIDNSTI